MIIGRVEATDVDNLPPIVYSISANALFDVDSSNGNIFLRNGATLDFEDRYVLSINLFI